jgi:hypothetical protein
VGRVGEMANNYEPRGTRFYANDKEMMLVTDDETRKDMHGWLLYKHPDGQWVSLRKATDADLAAINKAVVEAHHAG